MDPDWSLFAPRIREPRVICLDQKPVLNHTLPVNGIRIEDDIHPTLMRPFL